MCVTSLTNSITPTCAGTKKLGGVAASIYVGSILDLDAVTFDVTSDFITALDFATGKQLVKVTGLRMKHSANEPIEAGDNISLFNHTVNAIVFHSTQAQRNAIEDIVSLDQAFVILQNNAGQFITYGIAKNNADDSAVFGDYGLKVTGGDDVTGVNLNDQAAQTLTLTGMMPNKAVIFGEGSTVAENTTLLDGYLTPAV